MTNCPVTKYEITSPASGIVFASSCGGSCAGLKTCATACTAIRIDTGTQLIAYSMTIKAIQYDSAYPAGQHFITATKVVNVICGPSSTAVTAPGGITAAQQDVPYQFKPHWYAVGFKPSVINSRNNYCPIISVLATDSAGN